MKLDREEKDILKAYETGQLKSSKPCKKEKPQPKPEKHLTNN